MRMQPKDMYCEHGRAAESYVPKKACQTQLGIGKMAFVGRGSPSPAGQAAASIAEQNRRSLGKDSDSAGSPVQDGTGTRGSRGLRVSQRHRALSPDLELLIKSQPVSFNEGRT